MSVSLEFREVAKCYSASDQPAVQDINLSLNEGEILALVGASGSGKTTLLRLAVGLETPDTGQIILGERIVAGPAHWVPPERRGIGLVFQDGALFPHLTVEANLTYGIHKLSREEGKAITERLLEMVGLSGKEKRYPHELSGGERQRLGIVRALAPQPRVILLDEPFGNLDPALRCTMREEVRSLLVELKTTVILVTHDPGDSLAIAHRIAVLCDGRIDQTGTPEEIYRNPKSEYCAGLFGPANCLVDDSGKQQWVRPEQLVVVNKNQTDAIETRVVSVHQTGRHSEVAVLPTDMALMGDQKVWLLYLESTHPVEEGSDIWVTWNPFRRE
jgi:iron(III) transport system ATP-binding protein